MEWLLARVGKKRQGEEENHTPGPGIRAFLSGSLPCSAEGRCYTHRTPRRFGSCPRQHPLLRDQCCHEGLLNCSGTNSAVRAFRFWATSRLTAVQRRGKKAWWGTGCLSCLAQWYVEKSAYGKKNIRPPLSEKLKHPFVPGTILSASHMYEGHLVCSS